MAKSLMICGTGSHVGKSVITAGLCRIFRQDGFRVVPFKSQNMSLNSFVTEDGAEMGRAQVVQAECAGLTPHVDMNPILLKPASDVGVQVIISGKPVGNMDAKEYGSYRSTAFGTAKEAFTRLDNAYDIVVMEGAGSPAEVNLENDIVNLQMASFARAPVILVGDIDYGGVFAWIVGTLEIISDEQRQQIKGFIINKFRGDFDILKPGLDFLEKRMSRPVLGVVPFFRDIKIEEEDSVSLEPKNIKTKTDAISIEALYLPHVSNFTDFDRLEAENDVQLRYVKPGQSIGNPDVLIIPGSKNTIWDLNYLKEAAYLNRIKELADNGCFIVGICGGYQMLGKGIKDVYAVESTTPETEGLGLLNITTELLPNKITHQVKFEVMDKLPFTKDNALLTGYEIHAGRTTYLGECKPIFGIIRRQKCSVKVDDGAVNEQGNIWGTYIHGIFDNDQFRRAFINHVRANKGLKAVAPTSSYNKEAEYDKLADLLRKSLDIDKIYQIMGVGR